MQDVLRSMDARLKQPFRTNDWAQDMMTKGMEEKAEQAEWARRLSVGLRE